jgi:myo-inositol 2-dehydrogenase / D-chiro-inositol 1-dehydrogenase
VRIGVIGVGRIGSMHAGMLAEEPAVDQVILADIDQQRAQEVAADLALEATSIEEIFDRVDAVVIAAATSAHAQLIGKAASTGLPAFCEKPIAVDVASTHEVIRDVAGAGTVLQVGFQRRFDAGYRAAHDLVAHGELGTLYAFRLAGHDPAPPPEDYIAVSGGIFRDFSIHDFDALRFVTGQEVTEVYADGSVIAFPVFAEQGDVDTAVATLRLESGALGILSVTRHDPLGYDVRMELFGSGDSVSVGWDARTPLRSVEPGMPPAPAEAYARFQERFADAYRDEMAAFVEVAEGRRENPCTPEDALEALRVAVACDLSRAEHRPVQLAEVA